MVDQNNTQDPINEFASSVVPDVFDVSSFIDWPHIEDDLDSKSDAVRRLQDLIDTQTLRVRDLSDVLKDEPAALPLLYDLLGARPGLGFADSPELPREVPAAASRRNRLASQLLNLGLRRVLKPPVDLRRLLIVSSIARDSRRRGYRRGPRLSEITRELVQQAVDAVSSDLAVNLSVDHSPRGLPIRRRVDSVVFADGQPIAAVDSLYQARSGGRQQQELAEMYPALQRDLDEVPIALILVAEGPGIAESPRHVLDRLFESVASVMSLQQANDGHMQRAISSAVERRGLRSRGLRSMETLIDQQMSDGKVVTARSLPADRDRARLALATYVADHSELDLKLTHDGDRLSWASPGLVRTTLDLQSRFRPEAAIGSVQKLLSAKRLVPRREEGTITHTVLGLRGDAVVPPRLLVSAAVGSPNPSLLYEVSRIALRETPTAPFALLLVQEFDEALNPNELRRLQARLPTSVVVLDVQDLNAFARRSLRAREALVSVVLRQSDLTKVSPFVITSVTPDRMFFGRETEEATLVRHLAASSVALVGGRRIGKTSLMRHAESALTAAGFNAFFLDCQPVQTWTDFGIFASQNWDVKLPPDFRPEHVTNLLTQLQTASKDASIVVLLDEIDHLLKWDEARHSDQVSEALFRAFRAASQEGRAQFVFSGERTIARKIDDPQSPHWNFCRPIRLRQLTRSSANQLLSNPLEQLRVALIPKTAVLDRAWHITTGHPQIVQTLGDTIVRLLNDRQAADRTTVSVDDIDAVAETYEYREHYLDTYWGQATALERLISLLVAKGSKTIPALRQRLADLAVPTPQADLESAIRMLDLYGIIARSRGEITLRATFFVEAMESFSGLDMGIDRLSKVAS